MAVIVPNQREITDWASRAGILTESFTGVCSNRQVKKFLMDQINLLSKEAELTYYEEVKDIYLHPNLFSVGNGLLSKGGESDETETCQVFQASVGGHVQVQQFIIVICEWKSSVFYFSEGNIYFVIFSDK